VIHLEQVRAWFGRPLWEMEPSDADGYFGKVLRTAAKGTRLARPQATRTFFLFPVLRHKVEIHQMKGRVVECPMGEMNLPRVRQQAKLRIPPSAEQVTRLFSGWREELSSYRKFAPTARNYTACRLMADVGLRVNETRSLDLPDIKWDLGRFGGVANGLDYEWTCDHCHTPEELATVVHDACLAQVGQQPAPHPPAESSENPPVPTNPRVQNNRKS
jgi:integrase